MKLQFDAGLLSFAKSFSVHSPMFLHRRDSKTFHLISLFLAGVSGFSFYETTGCASHVMRCRDSVSKSFTSGLGKVFERSRPRRSRPGFHGQKETTTCLRPSSARCIIIKKKREGEAQTNERSPANLIRGFELRPRMCFYEISSGCA